MEPWKAVHLDILEIKGIEIIISFIWENHWAKYANDLT